MDIVKQRLRELKEQHGTQKDAARVLGVTPQYFSDLLAGRRTYSNRLLHLLGLRREIVDGEGTEPQLPG